MQWPKTGGNCEISKCGMTRKATSASPEVNREKRLEGRIENRRGPMDPGTQNEGHQTGDTEGNDRDHQIAPAPRSLFVLFCPKSVEASCENPSTPERIEKQHFAEVVGCWTVG